MVPIWSLLAFMDGGRVADEFEPSIRKMIRTDILVLLVLGLLLIVVGAAVIWAFPALLVTTIPLIAGAALVVAGVALWVRSR